MSTSTPNPKSSFFSQNPTLTPSSQALPQALPHSHSNPSCIDHEKQMSEKALQFVSRLRMRKKEMEGRMHMLRRIQAEKREIQEKRVRIQEEMQRELRRQIRRMKAEANIEYYRERKQMMQRNLSQSTSPRKRKLSEVTEQSKDQSSRLRLPSIHNEPTLEQIKQQQPQKFPSGIAPKSKKTARKRIGTIRRSQTESNTHSDSIQNNSNNNHRKQQQNGQAQQLSLIDKFRNPLHRIRLRSEDNRISVESVRGSQGRSRVGDGGLRDDGLQGDSYGNSNGNSHGNSVSYSHRVSRGSAGNTDSNKKYLMSRNRTDDLSDYLQQFSNISHFQTLNKRATNTRQQKAKNIQKIRRIPQKLQLTARETYNIENPSLSPSHSPSPSPEKDQQFQQLLRSRGNQ